MDEDKSNGGAAAETTPKPPLDNKGSDKNRDNRGGGRFKHGYGRGGEKRPNNAAQTELNSTEQKPSEQAGQTDSPTPPVQSERKPIKKPFPPRNDNRGGENRRNDNQRGDKPAQPQPQKQVQAQNQPQKQAQMQKPVQSQQEKRPPDNQNRDTNNKSDNRGGAPADKAADKNMQPKPDNRNVQGIDKRPDRNRRPGRPDRPAAAPDREPPNVIDDDVSVYLPEYLRPSAVKAAFVPAPEPEPESTPGVYFFPDDTAQVVFGDAPVEKPQEVPSEITDKVEIVDVRFKLSGKTYFFSPNGMTLAKDQNVIVETARGIEFGTVVQANRMVPLRDIVPPLKNVLRLASDEDKARRAANEEREISAFNICLEKIEAHKLDMKLVDAEYTFDNSKLLFYFSSEGRVDFRELARDLASVFRTRIELRQIGIRDEAKMMGGLGICGRPLCCSTFLNDFGQVSIKMAKEQSLSLNSAKISGTCGRLMCCLRYEYGTYAEEIAKTPRVDSMVETPDGPGMVTEISPLAGLVKVRLQKDPDQPPQLYHRSDLKPVNRRQAETPDGTTEVVADTNTEIVPETPAEDTELKQLEDN